MAARTLVAVLLASCSSSARRMGDAGPDAAQPAPTRLARPGRAAALRVVAVRGALEGSALPAQLSQDHVLKLPADSALTLALDQHVTATLRGPALALVSPEGARGLLVREGLVTVESAPASGSHRALWLATAAAHVEVVSAARLVVHARDDLGSALALVSGHLAVRARDTLVAVVPGALRCLSRPDRQPARPSVQTVEEAERTLLRPSGCPPLPRDARAALESALAAACRALDASAERERTLLAVHAGLVAGRETTRAESVQAELARVGALRLSERARTRVLRAQLATALLGATDAPSHSPLLARARELAPYDE